MGAMDNKCCRKEHDSSWGAIEFGFTREVRFTIFNLSRKEKHFPCGTRKAHLIPHLICYQINYKRIPSIRVKYLRSLIMNYLRKVPDEHILLHII